MATLESTACPHCGSANVVQSRTSTTFCQDCGVAFEEFLDGD